MTEDRFTPPPVNNAHCLACEHGAIEKGTGVVCNHPQRPPEMREVVKWFGHKCPQFTAKGQTTA